MKKLLYSILIPVFAGCSSITDITPQETFVKYYGDNAFYEVQDAISVQSERGQEFVILASRLGDVPIMVGEVEEIESGVQDFYIVHVQADGSILHEGRLEFDLTGQFETKHPSRIFSTESGYLVIGTIERGTNYLVWAMLDQDFVPTADVGWEEIGDGISNYYGKDIVELSNGDILVAGYTDENGDDDLYLTRLTIGDDPETTDVTEQTYTIWERFESTSGSDDRLVRAFPLSDGNIAVVGRTDVVSGQGEDEVNVERRLYDENGILLNAPTVYGLTWNSSDTHADIPADAIERPGGFIIVGSSYEGAESDDNAQIPFFMSLDYNGASILEKTYIGDINTGSSVSLSSSLSGITRLLTNNYLVVGQVDGFETNGLVNEANDKGKEIMYFIVDQGGDRVSDVFQTGLVNGDDAGIRTVAADDGSAIIAGNYDFGGGLQQIALIKVNADGQIKQ